MGQGGQRRGGGECAGNADPDHRACRLTEPAPADVHPAVEQDDRQRYRHQPLDGGDRQLTQSGNDVGGDRCG